MSVKGLAQVQRNAKKFADTLRRECRKAMARLGTKGVAAAKSALVVKRTGMTRRALGKKVAVSKAGSPYAMVGVRRGFKAMLTTTDGKTSAKFLAKRNAGKTVSVRGFKTGKPIMVNPTMYVHLIERGSKRQRRFPFLSKAKAVMAAAAKTEVEAAVKAAMARAAK